MEKNGLHEVKKYAIGYGNQKPTDRSFLTDSLCQRDGLNADSQTDRQRDTDGPTDCQAERERVRETDRQAKGDRQKERQLDRAANSKKALESNSVIRLKRKRIKEPRL